MHTPRVPGDRKFVAGHTPELFFNFLINYPKTISLCLTNNNTLYSPIIPAKILNYYITYYKVLTPPYTDIEVPAILYIKCRGSCFFLYKKWVSCFFLY